MLSAVLLALLPPSPEIGPLVKKGVEAPVAVCSAVAASMEGSSRLYTAKHCVARGGTHLWLPGLVGNGLEPGKSQWKSVTARQGPQWTHVPGQDLAWSELPSPVKAFPIGQPPVVGEAVDLVGYPQGKGPQRVRCVYQGVVVLTGTPPVLRRSLACQGLPAGPLQGFSGGAVLNARGHVVGVVVSGVFTPRGWAPGFEPLQPPASRQEVFWTVGTAVPAPATIQWSEDANGALTSFEIKGSDGRRHSSWPPLPSRPPTGSLRP